MTVLCFRATAKPDHVADVEAAAEKVFAALDERRPEGIRYASTLSSDGRTFVVLLQVDDGVENPLPTYREFLDMQAGLASWLEVPAVPEELIVAGSYRLF